MCSPVFKIPIVVRKCRIQIFTEIANTQICYMFCFVSFVHGHCTMSLTNGAPIFIIHMEAGTPFWSNCRTNLMIKLVIATCMQVPHTTRLTKLRHGIVQQRCHSTPTPKEKQKYETLWIYWKRKISSIHSVITDKSGHVDRDGNLKISLILIIYN